MMKRSLGTLLLEPRINFILCKLSFSWSKCRLICYVTEYAYNDVERKIQQYVKKNHC